MASFVVLTRLTAEGARRLKEDPGRIAAVNREVERMGGKIVAQYSTLGKYDFCTIVEARDNSTLMRIGAEISSLGTLQMTTSPTIEIDRFERLLKMQPYRTEPYRWQTAAWARLVRRVGRYWTSTRYVKRYCKPLTIEGQEHLASLNGPAVVIANHSSHLDSPVTLHVLPERIKGKIAAAAAADKFFASRKKRVWWSSLFMNAFPVHRGGGTKQLEYPLSLLSRGWSILIYPEGGRTKTGQVQKFKAGPSIMAMQAGVPVIPIYIQGLRDVMPKGSREPRPAPVHVRIGKPVSLAAAASVSEGTTIIENALRELVGLPPHHAHAAPDKEMAAAGATAGGG